MYNDNAGRVGHYGVFKGIEMTRNNFQAVIDMGSLALRLKIFEIVENKIPREIESARSFLSFGAQTYREGNISSEQVSEICDILSSFRMKLKEYRLSDAICVATSAFREAGNRDFIVEQIRLKTGLRIRVLDNAEERYFHNLAVKENQPDFLNIIQNGTMMLDIGSGSIQATVYDKSDLIFSQNMLLGSLRISEMLSDLERQTTHYADVLEEFISQDLDDYHAVEPKGITYQNFIAFGGDIGFIKHMAGLSPREYCFLTRKKFTDVYEMLLLKKPSDLILSDNIPAANAALLLPTVILVKKMLDFTDLDGVHLPAASLTDGVMYHHASAKGTFDLIIDPKIDVISAARHIAKRYRCDKKHIDNVEENVLAIFDSGRKFHGMGDRERLLLRISAILHEVGKYIHVSNHSSRSYHIINTMELIGLSETERENVACIARFYTKSNLFFDRYYQYLSPERKTIVSKLTAMMRIADAMDASHRQKLRNVSISVSADTMDISCDSAADLTFEQWAFNHNTDLFAQVFGIKPILRLRRQKQ
jgi:exopolyphosphatase/guanosine-5'-triphosphate,3'-diphosphate pyrophosphatase